MSDDTPQPIPRKSASGKKRSGPSMREQIAARRRTETDGAPAPEAAPAPKKAAPKKAAAPKAAPRAAAKSPAPKKAAAKPAAKAPVKAPAKAAAKPTAAAAKPAAKAATGTGRTRPTSRSSARGAGRSRSDAEDGDEEEGGASRGRRQRPAPKKKSPMPLIAAGVLIVGGGIGAYASGMFSPSEAEASNGEGATDDTTADAGEGTEAGTVDTAAADGAADGGTDAAAAADGEAAPDAAPAADADKPDEAPAKKSGPRSLEDVPTQELYDNLKALEPFGKPSELTTEEWAKFVEDAALVFEDGGGPSSRAEKRLAAAGKYCWPALLNELIRIDPANAAQNPVADRATLVMNQARGSESRFGFDYQTASKSKNGEMRDFEVRKNLRLIASLYATWAKVEADPEHWKKVDMSEQAAASAADAAKKLEDEFGDDDDDEFGDVDDIDID